jgi:anaerobic selenocysteine-containing dehydrogenase
MADLNPRDARRLGLRQGSPITVETAYGSIRLRANLTYTVDEGAVFLYQDYPDADVNSIIGPDHLDPISGFPGFRSVRCNLYKAKAEEAAI